MDQRVRRKVTPKEVQADVIGGNASVVSDSSYYCIANAT